MTQAHTTSRGYTLTPEQTARRGSILVKSAGRENRDILSVLRNVDHASGSDQVDSILDKAEKLACDEKGPATA